MLQRTARCLESGSLRCLLPGSTKPLKSRRMLHSSFWNHGAAELQLSLWANLFCDRSINQDGKNLKSHADIATGLLDFLSSPGAVKYMWQCPPSRCDRQEGQRLRAGFSRTGQRFYA